MVKIETKPPENVKKHETLKYEHADYKPPDCFIPLPRGLENPANKELTPEQLRPVDTR